VPDRTRKRVLEVQHHPLEIRIFEDGELVARHPVLEGRSRHRVDPGHRWAASAHPSPLEAAVARRPLAFYDAVARRLAAGEALR